MLSNPCLYNSMATWTRQLARAYPFHLIQFNIVLTMRAVYRYSVHCSVRVVTCTICWLNVGALNGTEIILLSLTSPTQCCYYTHDHYHDSKRSTKYWKQNWPNKLSNPERFKHEIEKEEHTAYHDNDAKKNSGNNGLAQVISLRCTHSSLL
jgi:hypothetical protein